MELKWSSAAGARVRLEMEMEIDAGVEIRVRLGQGSLKATGPRSGPRRIPDMETSYLMHPDLRLLSASCQAEAFSHPYANIINARHAMPSVSPAVGRNRKRNV